jgi:hypothetical protein
MKKDSYKVGITVVLKKGDSVFANGIRQNGLMLAKLLKLAGHEITILNFVKTDPMKEFPWSEKEYKTINIFEKPSEPKNLDILIHLQTIPNEQESSMWRQQNPDLKIVAYKCGNNYVNDMEDILFQTRETKDILLKFDRTVDAVWYVPQQELNNNDYYSILYKKDANAIPFVWDPMFIDGQIAKTPDAMYKPKEGAKRIAMFEPNLNIVKYSVPCILAIEAAYRKRPDLIGFMYASNTNRILDVNLFKAMMNQLDIVRDGKSQFTKRYGIVPFLASNTDIVISHQWGNPLNYLYLDVLYMGYPLVHNAHMIADLGYYYEDFNLVNAGDMLIDIAENYDGIYKEYHQETLEKLKRYMPENKRLQEEYTNLLHTLFDADLKNSMSMKLDWKTNLYK